MTRVREVDYELPRGMVVIEDPEFVTLLCHWCGWEQHWKSARLAALTLVNVARNHYAMSCRVPLSYRNTPLGKGGKAHAS